MLAIDCGNSRIKWAAFRGGHRSQAASIALKDMEADEALAGALRAEHERVVVANVAGPDVAQRLSRVVPECAGVEPEFVAVTASAHGIECGYADPATLGVDRWLAMIAARHSRDVAFIVVSAGTAVTLDAVDAAGRHLGGLILPGDRLMIEALARNTSQIPLVDAVESPVRGLDLLGRSTQQAVAHGARLALAAAIDRAVAEIRGILAAEIELIMTGGDAGTIAKWLATDVTIEADLVLKGLAVVAGELE